MRTPNHRINRRVSHLGVVAVLPVGRVAHDLRPSIRQRDSVLAARHVAVADCLVGLVIGGRRVIDRVGEIERHARLVVMLERHSERENQNNETSWQRSEVVSYMILVVGWRVRASDWVRRRDRRRVQLRMENTNC